MNIGFDFDGVFANTGEQKSRIAKKKFGVSVSPGMFRRKHVVGRGHMTHGAYHRLSVQVYWQGGGGVPLRPMPGAVRTLQQLLKDGHTLVIISSRSRRAAKFARSWSRRMGVPIEVVGVGKANPDKRAAAEQYRLDAFVDNDLEKLTLLKDVVRHRYLFTEEHNARQAVNGTAIRVSDWDELYKRLSRIKT